MISDRIRFPSIILYFFWGIFLGPHGAGLIMPSSLGQGLNIIITVFVSIILFEGGLSLDFQHLKSIKTILLRHILLTILITMSLSLAAAYYIADIPFELAIIFASLAVVTGPTVIKPIIRNLPLRKNVKTLLNGEAVIIDAAGAVMSIAIIEYIVSKQLLGLTILGFLISIAAGIATGVMFGLLIKLLLKKTSAIPASGRSIFTLGMLFFVFFISELISKESGLMAVAVFGISLGTIDYRDKEKLLSFKEQISRIIISFLFILLSANFDIARLKDELIAGLVVVGVIIAARFPAVYASTAGGMFSWAERFFIGWLGPRGIIALSVASIAVIKLKSAGIQNADIIEILVFTLISVTVLLQGLSASFIARRIGVLVEGDQHIIILGINSVTIGLALNWRKHQNDVLFIDSDLSNCDLAGKMGFQYINGNGLAPDTFSGIEVDYYSSVLAATSNNEINVLFCRFLKKTYGIKNLYVMLSEKSGDELSEIIRTEGIKLTCNCMQESRVLSFISTIREYFSIKKPVIKTFLAVNTAFLKHEPGTYPLPKNMVILFVARKERNCHLFHDSFKLEKNDVLYVLMKSEEDYSRLEFISSEQQIIDAR
ncbi:MAG TPA: sodium:proton antiporter [Spirochaetota bacterium]|nr:sodium:proton antiporter [Spirochaetota bacterium]HPN12179.1 sodium:proton antiporter [Spirochaetota bacterium]